MKSALVDLVFLFTLVAASHGIVHQHRQSSGWVQNPSGNASFTAYSSCQNPSCGVSITSGYTAAVNVLSFGANSGAGDACGRCFQITPTSDPYTPSYPGPMGNPIIVRVTDLCPFSSGSTAGWCDQTVSKPLNQYGMSMHFDLCEDTKADTAFFPSGRGAMLGTYQEVSCTGWNGGEGISLWGNSCMAPDDAPFWPSVACGNGLGEYPP